MRNAVERARLDSAYKALAGGDLNSASRIFRDILDANTNQIGALVGLAEVERRQGNISDAESHVRAAFKLAPENAEVQRAWARLRMLQNKPDEAEAALNKALRLEPDSYAAHKDLGDLYLQQRKFQQAVQVFRTAMKLSPSSAEAHLALATALAGAGKPPEAEKEFRAAVSLDPRNAAYGYSLALWYLETRRTGDAQRTFTELIGAHPKYAPAYVGRGDTYVVRGDDAKALEDYTAALSLEPRLSDAQFKIGLLHLHAGRTADAERAFRAVINLDANHPYAYNNLAFLAAERKTNLDAALVWARRAVSLAPAELQFQDTLAWVHNARGELDRAIAILEDGIRIDPRRPDMLYHLGIIYSEKGRTQQAATCLKKALAAGRDFAEAQDARRRLAMMQ
jgi:tetratricopeptide (TPR) repeat protein